MAEQKQGVVELVDKHRDQRRTVAEVLKSMGVARSSYYRGRKTTEEIKMVLGAVPTRSRPRSEQWSGNSQEIPGT
jgi:hypothetical protein